MRHRLLSLPFAFGLALLPFSARAEPGALLETSPLPAGLGSPAGLAFDGDSLWVATLRTGSEPASSDALLRVSPQGDVLATYPGGPGRIFQKLTFDGERLLAAEMYDELHHVGPQGGTLESFDIPFAQGIASDPVTGRIFVLEGLSSRSLHTVVDGAVTATVETVGTHGRWWGLAWDGCALWTSDDEGGELVQLEASTGAELARVPAPTPAIADLAFVGDELVLLDRSADLLLRVDIQRCASVEPPVDVEPPEDEDPAVDEEPVEDPPVDEEPVEEPPVDEEPVEEELTEEPPLNDPPVEGERPVFEAPPSVELEQGCAATPAEASGLVGLLALLRRRRRLRLRQASLRSARPSPKSFS